MEFAKVKVCKIYKEKEMNKAVFLDRDGTINVDFGYVYEKDKLEFVPGVMSALANIKKAGFKLIIITNQSGIGRGYYTLLQYKEFEAYMLNRMADEGVIIDGIYVCPHAPQDNCNCRKPKGLMYEQAAKEFDVDWKCSYVVGDSKRDLAICNVKDIQGIFYGESEQEKDNIISCADWMAIETFILNDTRQTVLRKEVDDSAR